MFDFLARRRDRIACDTPFGQLSSLAHPFEPSMQQPLIYLTNVNDSAGIRADIAAYPAGPAPTIRTSVRTVSPMLAELGIIGPEVRRLNKVASR